MSERRGLKYIWRTVPRAPSTLFQRVKDVHPAMVQVMYTRGLADSALCEDFLAGVCRDPDDPNLLQDVPRAVERLAKARQNNERVAVFTDYDADGVNSAAVLSTGLRLVGIEPRVRLPNRFVDGYGLTPAIVDELAQAGAQVIVTADCGSSSHEAADLARARGVDLIITDHHQCPDQLPNAYALVNPWRPDCGYPCDYLCGAGVAFKLVQALAEALLPDGRAAMEPLLDLVAVATVADIMPLLGENRRLVLAGLNIMNAFPRPGVRALIETSGLKPGDVDAAALGFRVAPRVNAAGRLDDPNIAYRLLMSDTFEEAFALAAEVNRLNEERQALTRTFELEAHELVQAQFESGEYALVCGGDDWPGGIVGLVAGKLAQAYNRPTLVYRQSEGMVTGSGRSIQGFNLLGALQACDDVFDRYGGHQAAAGFSLHASRLGELVERFQNAVRETLPPERLEPILWIDGYLRPETISYEFARSLERLAPFGAGFQYPTFAAKGLRLTESRQLGAGGQHWRARFRAFDTVPVEAVFFDHGQLATQFHTGDLLDTAFRLKRTRFDGYWRLEMELLDVASSSAALLS
ncbi:MAG: single-stranded-DNA-specific exonuclease RecJ [Chloroflexi bacterium]|nr:single-stranded-DNA-specific exonuclease RecJ [Chloroflexota bacterium]MBV9894012.1 single-stranded-DNA-specific exonuclease RecJ [Chloroflexota bacterium]